MTKIKICGITNLKDALAAVEAGADLLGFNFYLKSPRYIEPDVCQEITSVLRKNFPNLTLVGVFVNASVLEIRSILETCQLHLAQLHGDETPDMLAELGGLAFKAVRLSADTSVHPFLSVDESASPLHSLADRPVLLVDAAVKGLYGGSGVVADWSAAAELAKQIPLLLAGGLTPDNVGAAIRQVQPWGVDVASGVERSPGMKDAQKMRDFVAAVLETENVPKAD
jgi:phosphoribosylanthranilate isomerase